MKFNLPNLTFAIGHVLFRPVQLTLERMGGDFPMHAHGSGSYELHLIADGKGLLRTGDREYPLSRNCCCVTGPNIGHEQLVDPSDPMSEYCIYLTTERLDGPVSEIADIFLNNAFWFGEGETLLEPMRRCFEELGGAETGCIEFAVTYLRQIILLTARMEMAAPFPERVEKHFLDDKFLRIEEMFLYSYDFVTLDSLAAEIGFSTRQTQRILKAHYGKSFREMRDEARLSQAKYLLETGTMSVSDIAQRVGYSSLEHFSYAFKRRFRVSPLKWKKGHFRPSGN